MKNQKPMNQPKASYRFSCDITNLDIINDVDKVYLEFNGDEATANITFRNTYGREMIKEVCDYSKLDHTSDTITINLLDGSHDNNSVEKVLIYDFKIEKIIVDNLDYSNSEAVHIKLICTGKYING